VEQEWIEWEENVGIVRSIGPGEGEWRGRVEWEGGEAVVGGVGVGGEGSAVSVFVTGKGRESGEISWSGREGKRREVKRGEGTWSRGSGSGSGSGEWRVFA
jgi:hypothetical protein